MRRKPVQPHYAGLARLITLANCLPPGVQWPAATVVLELEDGIRRLSMAAQEKTPAAGARLVDLQMEALEARRKVLDPVWDTAVKKLGKDKDIPRQFRKPARAGGIVVIHGEDGVWTCNDRLKLYTAAWAVREALRKLAATQADLDDESDRLGEAGELILPAEGMRITFLPNGAMHANKDLFRDFLRPALDGRNLRRIRVCQPEDGGCGRLFLAGKKNQRSCSAVCANRVRVARFYREHGDYNLAAKREERRQRKEKEEAHKADRARRAAREKEKKTDG